MSTRSSIAVALFFFACVAPRFASAQYERSERSSLDAARAADADNTIRGWTIVLVAGYLTLFGAGGAYVASQRGRPVNEGVILSLLFGPFGLIVVACLPPVDARSPERTKMPRLLGTYAMCEECQNLKSDVQHGLCPECTTAINARKREGTRTEEFLRDAQSAPLKPSPTPATPPKPLFPNPPQSPLQKKRP